MDTNTKPKKAGSTSLLMQAFDDLLGLHKQSTRALSAAKKRNLTEEERQAISHYEEGLQKTLDLIAPAGMEVHPMELILNDQYTRTLYVYNWPNYIYPNWLSQAINFDAQMDITQYIYPTSNRAIMKMLRKKVAEMRSSIRILEQRGIVRDPALEAALQDAEELRDLLARGREKLYQFGMYVTLYADDEEKLKKLQTDVESVLGGKLLLTKPAFFQMEHGWLSSLPLAVDELEVNRNMNTSPLATSFPFSSSDLTDDHGILYGINRHNDSLVIFDRFDLPNANATVFATSGAGKSFTVKLEILRMMMFDTDIFVIDPENEYVDLCKTVGGTYIPLSLQSSFRINPFDLPKAVRGEDAKPGEVLRSAVITLHGLFKIMLGTLTPSEDGILDKAILDTYALKGIDLTTENPGELEPPTMGELVDVLMTTDGGENMAKTLQKYTEGSYAGLFNQPTNVELNNQIVVFQIRDLEEQLRPIAMYIVLNFLWNRIRADLKRRFLVIDEAWNLMQHDDSARFLYGLIKRARKYYLGVTTITQDVEDFVNSPFGKPIITNASLQILLKQSPTAVDNLQKLFYLTDGEKYLLLNSDVGQGLFFAGNKHVAIQIVASPQEEMIITTNPEEVLAIREARKREEKAKRLGEDLIPKGVDSSGEVNAEKAAEEAKEEAEKLAKEAELKGEDDVTKAAEEKLAQKNEEGEPDSPAAEELPAAEEPATETPPTPEPEAEESTPEEDPTQLPLATLSQATPSEEEVDSPANEPIPESDEETPPLT